MSSKKQVAPQEDKSPEAYKLYRDGWTMDDIAVHLGYPDAKLCEAEVKRHGQKRTLRLQQMSKAEKQALQLARLDRVLEIWMPLATTLFPDPRDKESPNIADEKAAGVVLKVISQQSQLMGLQDQKDVEKAGQRSIFVTGTKEEFIQTMREAIGGEPQESKPLEIEG